MPPNHRQTEGGKHAAIAGATSAGAPKTPSPTIPAIAGASKTPSPTIPSRPPKTAEKPPTAKTNRLTRYRRIIIAGGDVMSSLLGDRSLFYDEELSDTINRVKRMKIAQTEQPGARTIDDDDDDDDDDVIGDDDGDDDDSDEDDGDEDDE